MKGRPDPITRFDELTAEEKGYAGGEMALSQATRAAERVVDEAKVARIAAEAEALRGLGDRREEAAQGEGAAHQAVADAKLRRAAANEAVLSLRRERAQLVEDHRETFLATALAANEDVKAAATKVIEALARLRDASVEGTRAMDRLRARDHQYGGHVAGRAAELPFSLSTINEAVGRAARAGLTFPTDVAESGAPISRKRLADAAMRAG
jgi:hypothetical protein